MNKPLNKGILIFTNEAVLEHKQEDGYSKDDCYCFWETNKIPVQFTDLIGDSERPELLNEFPIYFAIKGKVRGYFIVHNVEHSCGEKEYEMWFYSESWHEIKDGDQLKPSQGWRYYPK